MGRKYLPLRIRHLEEVLIYQVVSFSRKMSILGILIPFEIEKVSDYS